MAVICSSVYEKMRFHGRMDSISEMHRFQSLQTVVDDARHWARGMAQCSGTGCWLLRSLYAFWEVPAQYGINLYLVSNGTYTTYLHYLD